MADMAEADTLDLTVPEDLYYPVNRVDEAISELATLSGGFSNFVINP